AFIKIKPREAMLLPLADTSEGTLAVVAFRQIAAFCKRADVLAIGPGLTGQKQTQGLIRKVIGTCSCRKVIDADGLNALAGHLKILSKGKGDRVLTPHPGEMARLLGSTVQAVQKNRKKIAKDFANRYNIILVLKGFGTLVAGRKKPLYVNKTGNPGMAKGGSGDVLTGIIAAFMAQGLDAYDAAKYGAYLHGVAGDIAARKKTQLSMTAGDIIASIPSAIKKCSKDIVPA
ncbi:MAG: NAD(P)H-hydrate dehydratase, partial [Candidatus Omnitrophica bacterium]|nr:NAD(P)H-hydrate dehydratase [Candidatus Omnitrophota bacterium]